VAALNFGRLFYWGLIMSLLKLYTHLNLCDAAHIAALKEACVTYEGHLALAFSKKNTKSTRNFWQSNGRPFRVSGSLVIGNAGRFEPETPAIYLAFIAHTPS